MDAISVGPLPAINNDFYDELGERWYQDDGHIIALLRAEAKLKLQYVRQVLLENNIQRGQRVIDIGCGAGFIANELGSWGYKVIGIDQSADSLAVAKRHADPQAHIEYKQGDAYQINEASGSLDVALLLDVLEHVNEPEKMLAEAARVLKPGGLLFFHTFNRTRLSRFLAIKAVEFVARDSPKHFHVWHLFIKPEELEAMGRRHGVEAVDFKGIRPVIGHWPFWSSLLKRKVHRDFSFDFTQTLALGYIGFGIKKT